MVEPNAAENHSGAPGARDDDEIDLLDLAIVLAKHKRLLVGLPVFAGLVAAVVSLIMTPIYTGTTKIVPPQQAQSSSAALLGQLAAIGGTGNFGLKNPSDLYVAMIRSRSIADRLVERFDLKVVFRTEFLGDARKLLADRTTAASGKDGVITIEYEDPDPERAAAIANAYVEELERLNGKLAVTEAAQRRLFFQQQLIKAQDELSAAELALKKTQENTGVIQLDQQGKAIIEAVATLRAQAVEKEIQLGAMRSFATAQNPDFLRTQQELRSIREQLRKAESETDAEGGDMFVPTSKVPSLGLEYVRKVRDVKYREMVYELLTKQFELARLDEAKDASIIQVLDEAVVPDRRSRPKRSLIVIMSALVGAVMAVLLSFLAEAWHKARYQPDSETGQKWSRLRELTVGRSK